MVSDDNKRIWMISTSLLIRDQKKKKMDICKYFYIIFTNYHFIIHFNFGSENTHWRFVNPTSA